MKESVSQRWTLLCFHDCKWSRDDTIKCFPADFIVTRNTKMTLNLKKKELKTSEMTRSFLKIRCCCLHQDYSVNLNSLNKMNCRALLNLCFFASSWYDSSVFFNMRLIIMVSVKSAVRSIRASPEDESDRIQTVAFRIVQTPQREGDETLSFFKTGFIPRGLLHGVWEVHTPLSSPPSASALYKVPVCTIVISGVSTWNKQMKQSRNNRKRNPRAAERH